MGKKRDHPEQHSMIIKCDNCNEYKNDVKYRTRNIKFLCMICNQNEL